MESRVGDQLGLGTASMAAIVTGGQRVKHKDAPEVLSISTRLRSQLLKPFSSSLYHSLSFFIFFSISEVPLSLNPKVGSCIRCTMNPDRRQGVTNVSRSFTDGAAKARACVLCRGWRRALVYQPLPSGLQALLLH